MKRHILFLLAAAMMAACHEHHHEHEHEACEAHEHEHEHDHDHEHTSAGTIKLSPDEARAWGVATQRVEAGTFVQCIDAGGRVDYPETSLVTLAAPTAGRFYPQPQLVAGAKFGAGVLLGRLVADDMAGGDPVRKSEAAFRIAQENMERMERLLEARLITRDEYNEALSALEQARIAHRSAQQTLDTKGHRVTAPSRGGTVMNVLVREGEFVEAGAPLVQVVAGGKMMLTAYLPLRHGVQKSLIAAAAFCVAGGETFLHTDSLHGRLLPRQIQSDGANLALRWEIDADEALVGGSFARVKLFTAPISGALCVPLSALIAQGGAVCVYVQLDDDCYCRRCVTVGGNDGSRAWITGGLAEGDIVVTRGAASVRQAGMGSGGGHGHSHSH